MFIDTKYRTDDSEIMDDFTIEGEILKDALDKIAKINQLLGGNQLTLQGVQELISKNSKDKPIMIIDIGCGNGDMLRELSEYGEKNNFHFQLLGVDANNFTINYARELSIHYPNISYICEDIFDKSFSELEYDIALCTLTLHHFKEEEIIKLMTIFEKNSRIGFIINDLHRSAIAYRLFQLVCIIFRLNEMSRKDGLTSILRGFKKEELIQFSKKLNLNNYRIRWKWAFRYQWIIKRELQIIN
ncbi:methyltransferase domain-containing protein [Flavobacterium luteum]|uniref:Methyltransferase domain-containing protein n=1 Tax=Flavobacterium luteum TaxID=2026654 RepID=A0A7J5AK00_9FLAO|nr:methyltransferase domain-containing protein [Flavobacterium luteum]KAB1157906.1 methyltransferase domain-containing protein [Flavobacterium luteum]